jgi:hypothetical protein
MDAQATRSFDGELHFVKPTNSTPLARLPDEDTPGTACVIKPNHGLEKSDLKKTASIPNGSDRKLPIQAETQISKFESYGLKIQTSDNDVVCEPLKDKGQASTIDPVRELREIVQELKIDLDHERTMREALEKRVSVLELEQRKCEPKS